MAARPARTPNAPTRTFLRIALSRWWHIVWTSFIGLAIGVLPGAGASIASFVAYQQSRFFSRTPEAYGTGHPEGVIAPESANNGVTAGTLVPLLTLGIPGGSTAAVDPADEDSARLIVPGVVWCDHATVEGGAQLQDPSAPCQAFCVPILW